MTLNQLNNMGGGRFSDGKDSKPQRQLEQLEEKPVQTPTSSIGKGVWRDAADLNRGSMVREIEQNFSAPVWL